MNSSLLAQYIENICVNLIGTILIEAPIVIKIATYFEPQIDIKKLLYYICVINTITNVTLTLVTILLTYTPMYANGALYIGIIILEVIILIWESVFYRFTVFVSGNSKKALYHAFITSAAANIISATLGTVIVATMWRVVDAIK